MSQLPPTVLVQASTPMTGGSCNFPLNNSTPVRLVTLVAVYTATATVGNRVLTFQIKAPPSLIVWEAAQGTAIVASTTVIVQAGDGAIPGAVTGPPIVQTSVLPGNLILPPLSIITLADGAAVDAADAVVMRALLVT